MSFRDTQQMAKKIKINDELYEKTRRIVEELGYASVDEFVTYKGERVNPPGMEDDDKAIVDRLKGLGYIACSVQILF